MIPETKTTPTEISNGFTVREAIAASLAMAITCREYVDAIRIILHDHSIIEDRDSWGVYNTLGIVNYNLLVPRHRQRVGELETIMCQLGEATIRDTKVPVKEIYDMWCASIDITYKPYPGITWHEHEITLNIPGLVKRVFDTSLALEAKSK